MGEFTFKALAILIIAIVAFIAFKAGSIFGSKNDDQTTESVQVAQQSNDNEGQYSLIITSLDHDILDQNSGEKGMRVNIKVVLASGKHSYNAQFWIFDENGNMVNLENNVELKADLGEWSIKDNSYNENEGDFFIPYFILPNNKGRTNYIIAGRLDRDNVETVAESNRMGFYMVR